MCESKQVSNDAHEVIVNINGHHCLPIFSMIDIPIGKSEAATKPDNSDVLKSSALYIY